MSKFGSNHSFLIAWKCVTNIMKMTNYTVQLDQMEETTTIRSTNLVNPTKYKIPSGIEDNTTGDLKNTRVLNILSNRTRCWTM